MIGEQIHGGDTCESCVVMEVKESVTVYRDSCGLKGGYRMWRRCSVLVYVGIKK